MYGDRWKTCVEFHGHACPGLASGYRASVIAMGILGKDLKRVTDEDIVCVVESEGCGVDSIQCLLSCTIGKGNLILRPRGKTAYTFFDRESGKGVRLVMKPLDREGKTKEEMIDFVMSAPPEDVFYVKEPGFGIPERARIFRSRTCDCCGESVREDMVRFQDGAVVCLDCFKSYDRGWM